MTNWHQGTLVAFDTETTSADPETARIVSAAIVTMDPVEGSVDTTQWLADPGIDIPAEATAVHGITTEMARAEGRPPAEVVHQLMAELDLAWDAGHPVIIYNAPYDLTVLDRELQRHDFAGVGPVGAVIDPLVIDKQFNRRYGKGLHQLGAACAIYGIPLSTEDAHGAAADAFAAGRMAWHLAARHPEIADMDFPVLHARQAVWYAEQADEFARYLRRVKLRHEGADAADAVHIERDWPMRPVPAEAGVA